MHHAPNSSRRKPRSRKKKSKRKWLALVPKLPNPCFFRESGNRTRPIEGISQPRLNLFFMMGRTAGQVWKIRKCEFGAEVAVGEKHSPPFISNEVWSCNAKLCSHFHLSSHAPWGQRWRLSSRHPSRPLKAKGRFWLRDIRCDREPPISMQDQRQVTRSPMVRSDRDSLVSEALVIRHARSDASLALPTKCYLHNPALWIEQRLGEP